MKLKDYIFTVIPRAITYAKIHKGTKKPTSANPLTLTFSVTAACQSRCKTCNIGNVYLANPKIAKKNLSLEEIEKVFKSLGEIYFFNVSGGEPFMRKELAEIIKLACIHLKPKLIHIPTNALSPPFIDKTTRKILEYMEEYADPATPISIKPSIDGIGEMHDYVRGVKGNFKFLEKTIDVLLAIRKENPRLHVDLGTVISNLNIHHLDDIENWVHQRGIESYRHEIAEQRSEFHNLGDPITPSHEVYEKLTRRFQEKIRRNLKSKALLTRTTEAVRLTYYDVAVQILRERRQVTNCYAGISNIHMNYNGNIWPCCVLGDEQIMGNVRDYDYDIQALLRSEQSDKVRKYIADKNCACPLANQWLNNVLLTPKHMFKVMQNFLRYGLFPGKPAPEEKPARIVDPDDATANVIGTEKGKAVVLKKAGTIPEEEEVDLPVFQK